MIMRENIVMRRWLYVLNGFVTELVIGCSYTWGVFVVPLEQKFGWTRSDTSLAFTLNLVFFSLGVIAAGYLSRRFRFASLLRAAAIMIGAGFLLSSMADRIWQIYLTYSFLCGFGIGTGYNCVISSVPQWFPDKPAAITGILLIGFAASTAILGPVINALIASVGITSAFQTLAAVCCVVVFLTSFGLKTPDDNICSLLPRPARARSSIVKTGWDCKQMLRSPTFWLDYFTLAFISGSGMVIINHINPLLQQELHSSSYVAAMTISAIFIFNAAGRISGGIFLDKHGLKPTLLCNAVIMSIAFSLLYWGMRISSIPLVIASSCLALLAFGSNVNMIPSSVRELFGQTHFAMNYPIMNTNMFIVALMPTIAGALQHQWGGYAMPFLALVFLALVDIALTIALLKSASAERLI